MRRGAVLCLLLVLAACMPATPPLQLPADCRAAADTPAVLSAHWLNGTRIWRLRQTALLEIGGRKIPLEGFLRLDLARHAARLVALNELGVVLFDLEVSETGEELLRAVPQLRRTNDLARGVAQSLRQIFLAPRPQASDRREILEDREYLRRPLAGGELRFLFDCRGDLRETRWQDAAADWRVGYDEYREAFGVRVPRQLVLNDYRHRVKLSLGLKEVKIEP